MINDDAKLLIPHVSFFKGGYTGRTGEEEEQKPVCMNTPRPEFIDKLF